MDEIKSNIPSIRAMNIKDLKQIIAIDKKILGKARPEYWEMKIILAEKHSPMSSLVAEQDGKIVGFVIGDASGWEYGVPENIGWIDTIGVDPAYQKKGIARMLFSEMVNNFKKVGVNTVYTFVTWSYWKLLQFFNKAGFQTGQMLHLELKV